MSNKTQTKTALMRAYRSGDASQIQAARIEHETVRICEWVRENAERIKTADADTIREVFLAVLEDN